MHGRPRDDKLKLRDPRAQEQYKKKVDAIKNGTALILQCRKLKRYDEVVMNASAKLLKVVPEIYTIWNFRREALGEVLAAGGEEGKRASDTELALTQACLMENPKSYSAWHHRKWVVSFGLCSLEAEMTLIAKALDEDCRNFHAWNYRQFLVKRMGQPLEQELEYSEEKISQNFSNYSAWHYRTILLHKLQAMPVAETDTKTEKDTTGAVPAVLQSCTAAPAVSSQQPDSGTDGLQGFTDGAAASGGGDGASGAAHQVTSLSGLAQGSASQTRPIPVEVLDAEYDMVHQAFATDSGDQSPWMYYRWLVGNSLAHVEHAGADMEAKEAARLVLEGVLAREVSRLEADHLVAEPDAKWPLLTLARLKEAQVRLSLCAAVETDHVREEVSALYTRLMSLDPMRAGYYQDARDGKAFVVVSALGTV